MEDGDWYEESQWRAGRVVDLFKPEEVHTIQDFLETAKNERERAATEPEVSE